MPESQNDAPIKVRRFVSPLQNGTDMTEDKRLLKVFLCHAHTDREAVRGLYSRLNKDGVDTWLDKEKLLPGQDWELEIRKAVRESDVVVVCLSKQFNQAGFRQKEVRLALNTAMEQPEGEIFIIPARLEECETLESLRKWHWVDLFEDDGYEMLIRALRARADKIGVTLQVKRKFLPKLTTSQVKVRKPETNHPKQEEKLEDAPQSQAGKSETKTAKTFRKGYKQIFVALISVAVIILIALNPHVWVKAPVITSAPTQSALVATSNLIPSTVCATASENWDVYVVQAGDTLFSIAVAHDISLEELTTINCISGNNQIQVGAQILVPKAINIAPTMMVTVPPVSTEITDAKGVAMALVPEGGFTMGSNDFFANESPVHFVVLDAYYIDKYEVTNLNYNMCVSSGGCLPPTKRSSYSFMDYFSNPVYDRYPVIYVTWQMANKYCEWRSARLPTEAEWEKAARGTDGRNYPWGDSTDGTFANYNGVEGDVKAIGSYSSGISPYGLFDTAGNVQEWVSDWYQMDYYSSVLDEIKNPLGPLTGQERALRGGSWDAGKKFIRVTYRSRSLPSSSYYNIGFRCSKDIP